MAAFATCVAQAEPTVPEPTPGQAAPDITIQKLLNAPDGAGTSWEALRDKVVVLEFWATHCASCVSAIPLMNELEAAFANQPVVFLHVTNEDEDTLRKFLETRPIHGWIGIDSDRTTMKAYGVTGLPRTAIVGKDGRFLGWTRPFRLVNEPEILKQVLERGASPQLMATQPSPVDPLKGVPRAEQEGDPRNSLCDIVIRRSTSDRSKFDSGGGSTGMFRFSTPLVEHISFFWDVPAPRIVPEVALPEEPYDIVTRYKDADSPEFNEVMYRLIEVTFNLAVIHEKREMDAYVLRPVAGREPQLSAALSGVYTDKAGGLSAPTKAVLERMKAGEHFFFAACPLSMLADAISAEVNRPVVAELGDLPTRYDDVYTICFPYDKSSDTGFIHGLERNVGFTLAAEKRDVDVLVVRKSGRR